MSPEQWTELLNETKTRHVEAYAATQGFDPAWARWYAEYLQGRLDDPSQVTVEELEQLLTEADQAFQAEGLEKEEWPRYYADFLVDRLG